MTGAGAWASARRILLVRLDSLGDVIMTTPAIAAVRAARPDAHLALLTSPAGAAVASLMPGIDATIVYEAPWMKAGASTPSEDRAFIECLAARGFDAAILFTVFSQNPLPAALMLRLAGIPLVLAHSRERAYRLLSDEVPDPEPAAGIRHEVERQLALVATLGWHARDDRLQLVPAAEARAAARRRLAALGLAPRAFAVLHAGASAPSRRWPAARFAAVAQRLATRGCPALVVGDAREAALAAAVAGRRGRSLAGELTLAELAALIADARLFIGNNSGPMHVAAAMGTPVVALYAGTNPQHTPWRVPAAVLSAAVPCAPCFRSVCPEGHHRCLGDISVEAVLAAADRLAAAVTAA
jgi:lipopolysaccharide heptosyltransferase II